MASRGSRYKVAKRRVVRFFHDRAVFTLLHPVWGELMTDGPVRQEIIEKLTRAFDPDSLEVIDESHLHAGHTGWSEGGETHFRVKITAQAFADKKLVERHRMVIEALAEELDGPVHALAIKAEAPRA